jgi:hypothetical protein
VFVEAFGDSGSHGTGLNPASRLLVSNENLRPLIEVRPISRHPSLTGTFEYVMSLMIENTEWRSPGASLVLAPLRGLALLNVSLRHACKSCVKVVHAYCPATEHLRLLPEFFYSLSSGRPYTSMVSSLMNSPIGGNFGPATFMCRSSEAESGLMCSTVIRAPSSLKYTW